MDLRNQGINVLISFAMLDYSHFAILLVLFCLPLFRLPLCTDVREGQCISDTVRLYQRFLLQAEPCLQHRSFDACEAQPGCTWCGISRCISRSSECTRTTLPVMCVSITLL